MKKILRQVKKQSCFILTTAVLVFTGINFTSCQNKTSDQADTLQNDSVAVENDLASTNENMPYSQAINQYLIDEIGKNYASGQHCVPVYSIIGTDDSNDNDILVWGDYWVFNYNQVGDTLKMVSGGSHPGLIHLSKTDKGYEVTKFDQVADGAGNLESAKQIFGEKYEAFHAINSNGALRDSLRTEGLARYVKTHNIPVTMYQDYGWPAISLE